MQRNLLFILLGICVSMIFGCGGGPSYLRKDAGLEKRSARKYAIVVADYDVLDPAGNHISNEMIQQAVKDAIGKTIAENFQRSLLSGTVVKEADVKVAIDNYKAVPVNWRKVKLVDDTTNLGDQRETFKAIDADILLIVSGVSRVRNVNWATGLAKSAVGMAIAVATATIVPIGEIPPMTISFLTAVDRNGRVLYFDREQFTKHGDIIATDERGDMMASLFNRYYENMVK